MQFACALLLLRGRRLHLPTDRRESQLDLHVVVALIAGFVPKTRTLF